MLTMPYIRDRVIVLKKETYQEHDRRYYLYGFEYGLLTAVARGAALPKSKQAGHLEPLSESEIMIAQGRTFDKLAVARLMYFPQRLDNSFLASLFMIRNIFELVIALNRPGISDNRVFYLLQELIRVCEAVRPQDHNVLTLLHQITILRFLGFLGFAPQSSRTDDSFSAMSMSDLAKIKTVDSASLQKVVAYVGALLAQTPLFEKTGPDSCGLTAGIF